MLQRMMVALALLSRAPFIIADEPTTDLDAIAQARILDLLADIVARRGLGLLLVTHDMGVVARLAHHVTVMENGRLVEHCDVNTLFSAPRHPLSSASTWPRRRVKETSLTSGRSAASEICSSWIFCGISGYAPRSGGDRDDRAARRPAG